MEDLSDEKKFANYCRLLETIEFIESGGRITEDWMELQKEHILEMQNFFTQGFKNLNPEIKSEEFRSAAKEADTLMNSLLKTIYYDRTFEVRHYNILLNKLLIMFKVCITYHGDEDELTEFMNTMTLG